MKTFQAIVLSVALVVLIAGAIILQSDAAQAATCPSGAGCGCSMAYAPVICGKAKCRYTNMCKASCAGWTSSDCKDALN